MRILIALLTTIAYCLAAAPYPPSGTKPQGAVLVLPTEYGTPRANPDMRGDQDRLTDLNAKIMQRLKQEKGSEQGQYHVYLQDGRLQKVQYTTAPITPQQAQQVNEVPDVLRPEFAPNRAAYFVQVPQDRIQALQAARNRQSYTQTSQGFSSADNKQAQNDYLASVEFSPVEPITGPVYSYKPQPLTRILRYAPVFY